MMKRIRPPIDKKKYKEIRKGLSDYERNQMKNTPTAFTMEPYTEDDDVDEKYSDFDKVTYYRNILLK